MHSDDAEVFAGIFPNQHAFGEVLHEFEFNHAWINCVSWSPGYFRIAFAGTHSHSHVCPHHDVFSASVFFVSGVLASRILTLPLSFTVHPVLSFG